MKMEKEFQEGKWKPESLREALLYHRVVEWSENELVLENGRRVTIEMTESDCCASAGGTFSVEDGGLDAVITNVEYGEPETSEMWDGDSYESTVIVTLYHNQNPIAQADLRADAGNGGYYYSVASFIVTDVDGESFEFYGVHS